MSDADKPLTPQSIKTPEPYEPRGIRGNDFQVFWDGRSSFKLKSGEREVEVPLPEGQPAPSGGLLLAHNLGDLVGKRVCELGTNSHGVSMFAALLRGARSAYGVEPSEKLAEFLKGTFSKMGLPEDRAKVHAGYSIPDDAGMFDVIAGNLPQMPSPNLDETAGDLYNYAGRTGWEVIDQYLQQVNKHLVPGGHVSLGLLNFLGIEKRTGPDIPSAFERLEALGLEPKIVAVARDFVHKDHPFTTKPELFAHVRALYPDYSFEDGSYEFCVVEGRKKN